MEKLKVLSIIPDRGGIGYFRSTLPHFRMNELFAETVDCTMTFNPVLCLNNYDIVHVCKKSIASPEILFNPSRKYKVVLDIDDWWNDDPTITRIIEAADLVTTTTEYFKNIILKYNSNVAVLPNAAARYIQQFIPSTILSNKLRFGLLLGSSHEEDVKLLSGLANMIYNSELKDKVQLVLCGFDLSGSLITKSTLTGKVVTLPLPKDKAPYPKYEKILTDNYKCVSESYGNFLKNTDIPATYSNEKYEMYFRRWTKPITEYADMYKWIDVLLVPLKDTVFNRCKSPLKLVEAGYRNIPVIASDVIPYKEDIISYFEKGGIENLAGNGILIDNNKGAKAWFKAIKKLCYNPYLIHRIADNLYKTVRDKYYLDDICKKRLDIYLKLTGRC